MRLCEQRGERWWEWAGDGAHLLLVQAQAALAEDKPDEEHGDHEHERIETARHLLDGGPSGERLRLAAEHSGVHIRDHGVVLALLAPPPKPLTTRLECGIHGGWALLRHERHSSREGGRVAASITRSAGQGVKLGHGEGLIPTKGAQRREHTLVPTISRNSSRLCGALCVEAREHG